MKIRLYYILAFILLFIGLSSCEDERIYDPSFIGEGEATIAAEITFTPLQAALSRAVEGGTEGNAIKEIESLCLIFYNENGNLYRKVYLNDGEFETSNITDNPSDRPSSPSEAPDATGEHRAEKTTRRAKVAIPNIHYGRYYIYAIANVPESFFTDDVIKNANNLKNLRMKWDEDNISLNNQMFGYFSTKNNCGGFNADLITVNRENVSLHAWVRRLASKVTVAFDGSRLNEDVYIYIKSVQIKDIPDSCFIGKENVPNDTKKLITEGQTIIYGTTGPYNETYKARITKGHPVWGADEAAAENEALSLTEKIAAQHTETTRALYFYENMQDKGVDGTASDKFQIVTGDQIDPNNPKPSYPDGNTKPDGTPEKDPSNTGYKDNKIHGTYIEVTAYYESKNVGDVTKGDIVYRFMLGKDNKTDFNAERNYHYKLTMHFNKYANDVDWHIEYSRTPGIEGANPYYVSYLYNHSMGYPIQVNTEPGVYVVGLKGEIVSNGWAPANPGTLTYWYPANDPVKYKYNGFLSLHKTTKTVYTLTDNNVSGCNMTANQAVYDQVPKRGERWYFNNVTGGIQTGTYKFKGTVPNANTDPNKVLESDKFSVQVSSNSDGNVYKFRIPMYTRAKQLIKESAFTGNNPYEAYTRNAKVQFTAYLSNGGTYTTELININQVKRIVNPKGVYASSGSTKTFKVELKVRDDESDPDFDNLTSEGSWKAYVMRGQNVIKLESLDKSPLKQETIDYTYRVSQLSDNLTEVTEHIPVESVCGSTGEEVAFNINFQGVDGDAVVRVEYNSSSCYHLIFVKAGDAPVQLVDGGCSWYPMNMKSQSELASEPCDEGSLFKWNNWNGIDALKNKNNSGNPNWTNVQPDDFKGNAMNVTEWNSYGVGDSNNLNAEFSGPTLSGARIASFNDYKQLYQNPLIEQGYGILYCAKATGTSSSVSEAYGYDYDNNSGGMRGCFVYNKKTGKHIFFPIGASGYGHRKDILHKRIDHEMEIRWDVGPDVTGNDKYPVYPDNPWNFKYTDQNSESYHGVLRYCVNARWGWFNVKASGTGMYPNGVNGAPLFFDIFRRPGGIYWINKVVNGVTGFDSTMDVTVGWDINYFTFDFYPINQASVAGADACFIRCVR